MRRVATSALLLLGAAAGARGQVNTASYYDLQDATRCGEFIVDLGDVNGDGTNELFIGMPRWDTGINFSAGRAAVVDADDFLAIRYHDGSQTGAQWGSAACKLGDVDGDGCGDYAIGARYWNSTAHPDAGLVTAYSGKLGAKLWSVEGAAQDEELGTVLAWLGDVDHDGVDEFAASRPNQGEVAVYDANGQFHYSIVRGPNTEFAAALARCGDLDGDGVPELLVGEPGYDSISPPRLDCGRIVIYSGATGAYLNHVVGYRASDRFGSAVAGCGDLDHDGTDDFVGGATEADFLPGNEVGEVVVSSGATLAPLFLLFGDAAGDRLGLRVTGLRDFDGDGTDDLAASAQDGGSLALGLVRVYSGVDGRTLFTWEGYDNGAAGKFASLGIGLCAGDWNGDGFGDLAWADPDYSFDPGGGVTTTGAVNTFVGCPSLAVNYGAGWPGRNGVPALTALTEPQIGAPIDVFVGNSLGGSTIALLMVGSTAISTPTSKGGTLLATDDFASLLFTLDAAGTTLSEDIPWDPALYFAEFFVQVLEADPFASKKLSFTPGLHLRIGIDMP